MEIVTENLEPGDSVKSVKVKVGRLAAVIPDSLEFCFDAIRKGTPLEDAKLFIENVAIVVHCQVCGHESEIEKFEFQCLNCGGSDLKIISGDELKVVEIEIYDCAENPS